MPRREQIFNQFLRPLAGIGLPVNYNVPAVPNYESEIAFDRTKNKFLFSIEQHEGQEDFTWVTISRTSTVINVSTNYTIDSDDYVVLVDATAAPITITLPSASVAAQNEYNIKRINGGANKVTITASNGNLIDGLPSQIISYKYASITVVSDGQQWYII